MAATPGMLASKSHGIFRTLRWGGWVLLVGMVLTPVMPWPETRVKYGPPPWEVAQSEPAWRIENGVYGRDSPPAKIQFGFEKGVVGLVIAEMPVAPAPPDDGRRFMLLGVVGRGLFQYHDYRQAPWSAPSVGPVRWRVAHLDLPLLACLLAMIPAWRAVRRWRKRSPGFDTVARWSLRATPLLIAIVLWTTSIARTDYAKGEGRTLISVSDPGVYLSDFGHHFDVSWHSFDRAKGRVHGGQYFGFSYYSNDVSWAYVMIPYWALTVVTGLSLMTVIGVRVWRRRQQGSRQRQGQCLACGYDLRASMDRCPECGTPSPT